MENLRYARLSATDGEIHEACKAAATQADTGLSERLQYERRRKRHEAVRWELQRLAIVRIFLKDPHILVLDEATSAVDVLIESAIQSALRNITESQTTFAIAHRLAIVVNAGRILVMHEGSVVEHGTHEELLAQNGRYAQM